ncbi:sensor domain-containing diguanylate cyclase [Guptibacillus hwajinpoensis]|uniref:sensor domain-containing diguanylate cyclase n=1 Tax=Guptibacillus hwajinpoensis TaxID=208199 RepID=UPI001CFDFBF1|nr:sensor domain-containing diguanylate cyclase [Pseudalkalibacillus hwajinpoensis]WLR60724.1 sensor domain-containing diguanylate cyclase [Pseudalkalibacillus hwajinpoensis]
MTALMKRKVWLVWLLFWPLLIFATLYFFPPVLSGNWADVLALFVLLAVVAMMPINVKGTDLFFIQGISLAVFLRYGLFIEMILTQLAILVFLLNLRVTKKDSHRYPVNMLMFMLVSLVSGGLFYLLGGSVGEFSGDAITQLVPSIAYILSLIVVNQILLHFLKIYIYKETDTKFFGKDMLWEAISTGVTLPVGFLLYMLHTYLGTVAIFFVGVPFILASLMLRLYYSSQKVNNLLQQTSEIGQQITQSLDTDEILNVFLNEVKDMFVMDYAYIMDAEHVKRLTVIKRYENERGIVSKEESNLYQEGISSRVWRSGRSRLYTKRSQWKNLTEGVLSETANSVISVPMKRNKNVVGIITLASDRVRSYEKHHILVLQILANYLAVAVDNARHYEETKRRSERCPLTNLYNFRFFGELLDEKYKRFDETPDPFSIILLDLDHFKKVNDTFGHHSGNEVLCGVANRLEEEIGDRGTVARFGGEEFVVLLENHSHKKSVQVAEDLRCSIADRPFEIYNDLDNGNRQVIYVTASIGVATAPDQGQDAQTLIRNADRAMYTGAKQQGRNRVASYVG